MTMRRIVAVACAVACAMAAFAFAGCTSNTQAQSASKKQFDLTGSSISSSTVSEAFSTDDTNAENDVTIEGRYETIMHSDGGISYVVHLYIDGNDYHDTIFCNTEGLDDDVDLPADDTMVRAHGTWKHVPDATNDVSFKLYLDQLIEK